METLHLHNYRLTICESLWKQYLYNSLCDVVINTSDGRQIQAHRIVLAAFSDFFCQHFKMQNTTSTVVPVVYYINYSYNCMKALIDFMYSGKLDIPVASNSELFSAAVNLSIASVQLLVLQSYSSSCLSGKQEIVYSSKHQSDTDLNSQQAAFIVDSSKHQSDTDLNSQQEAFIVDSSKHQSDTDLNSQQAAFCKNRRKDSEIGTERKSTKNNYGNKGWGNTMEQVLSFSSDLNYSEVKHNTENDLEFRRNRNDLDLGGNTGSFNRHGDIDLRGDYGGNDSFDINNDIENEKNSSIYNLRKTTIVKRLIRKRAENHNGNEKREEISDSLASKHDIEKYKCMFCSKQFQSYSLMNIHLARKHNKFGIENCLRRAILNRYVNFQYYTKLFCRISSSEKIKTIFLCLKCNKTFQRYSTLNFHVKKHHCINFWHQKNILYQKLMNFLLVKKKFYQGKLDTCVEEEVESPIMLSMAESIRKNKSKRIKKRALERKKKKELERKKKRALERKKKKELERKKKELERKKKEKEERKKEGGDKVQCTLCSINLSCASYLFLHMMKIHQKSEEEAVKLTGYQKRRENKEIDAGLFLSCALCWKVVSLKDMKLHQKNVHNVEGINVMSSCCDCGKIFTTRYSFRKHLQTIQHQRKMQMRGSLGAKIYCAKKDCNFSASSILDVNLHVAECHQGVVYNCKECRFTCHLKSMLDTHYIRTHIYKDKCIRMRCQVCDKTFKHQHNCIAHEFKKHELDHPSIKLQKCPFEDCKYICVSEKNLKIHTLNHTKEKKVECQICGIKLRTKKIYERHIKKKHSSEFCDIAIGEDKELTAEKCEDDPSATPTYFNMGRKHDSFTAKKKLEVIAYALKHSNKAAGRHFKLNEANVRNWKKQYDKLKTMPSNKRADRGKPAKFPELETELYHWICEKRDEGIAVIPTEIRMHAGQLYKSKYSNIDEFKASINWCYRFRNRKGLSIKHRRTIAQRLPEDSEEK